MAAEEEKGEEGKGQPMTCFSDRHFIDTRCEPTCSEFSSIL